MTNPEILARFQTFLADGTSWIGIFENHDLGDAGVGTRIAFLFDDIYWERCVINITRAPETKTTGFGWRYILIAKCRTAEHALAVLNRTEWPLVEVAVMKNADDKP